MFSIDRSLKKILSHNTLLGTKPTKFGFSIQNTTNNIMSNSRPKIDFLSKNMAITSEQRKEYMKEYFQRPEVIERRKEYLKERYDNPEINKKIKESHRKYYARPEVKEKIREYQRKIEREEQQQKQEYKQELKKTIEQERLLAKDKYEREVNREIQRLREEGLLNKPKSDKQSKNNYFVSSTLLPRERPYKLGEGQPLSKCRVASVPLPRFFSNNIQKMLPKNIYKTFPKIDIFSKNETVLGRIVSKRIDDPREREKYQMKVPSRAIPGYVKPSLYFQPVGYSYDYQYLPEKEKKYGAIKYAKTYGEGSKMSGNLRYNRYKKQWIDNRAETVEGMNKAYQKFINTPVAKDWNATLPEKEKYDYETDTMRRVPFFSKENVVEQIELDERAKLNALAMARRDLKRVLRNQGELNVINTDRVFSNYVTNKNIYNTLPSTEESTQQQTEERTNQLRENYNREKAEEDMQIRKKELEQIEKNMVMFDNYSKNMEKEEISRRMEEYHKQKQKEFDDYKQQAKQITDNKQKAYIALKVAAQHNRVDPITQRQRQFELQKSIEGKRLDLQTPRGVQQVYLGEDESKEFGREMDLAMGNILVESEAQEHLSKDLYGKGYFELSPKDRNKVRYLLRTHRA